MNKQMIFLLIAVVGSTTLFSLWDIFLDITGNKTGANLVINEIDPNLMNPNVEKLVSDGPDLPSIATISTE